MAGDPLHQLQVSLAALRLLSHPVHPLSPLQLLDFSDEIRRWVQGQPLGDTDCRYLPGSEAATYVGRPMQGGQLYRGQYTAEVMEGSQQVQITLGQRVPSGL